MWSGRWWLVVFSCALWACSEESSDPVTPVAGQTGNVPAIVPGTGGTPAAPAPVTDPASLMPCGVADLVSRTCLQCHGAVLKMAAPMPLLTPAHFQAEWNGRTVAQAAHQRLQDTVRPMPPPPNAALAAADLSVMLTWLEAGAAADPAGCATNDPTASELAPPPTTGGEGGTEVPGAGTEAPPTVTDPPVTTMEGTVSGPRWTLFGYDLTNSRSNPDETTLSAASAGTLRRLWEVSVQGSTSTPAVADGVVYLPAWDGNVHAVRLEDGGEVWTTPLPDLIDSSPALSADRVFVADDSGVVHALDRATGMPQWATELDPHPEAHLWSSPIYVAGANLIVIGVASGDEALPSGSQTFRGSVVGLDAGTGAERFRFDTTSAGGGVGVAVWATAAVDTGRKLLYVGTGNNYTAPTGPYADSMLAIDYETGMLAWSTQFTADDVFIVGGGFGAGPDFDIGSTANLFTTSTGQDVVGIGVKSGIYYALDRDTGTQVWMQMLTPGSPLGGVMSPSAYDQGVIYVASNVSVMGNTKVFALEADNGNILWQHDLSTTSYGGIAHANGVVYLGVTSGTIYALDALSGNELWSDTLPNAIAGGPSVVDGKLLVPWGYTWTLRNGGPVPGGLVAYGQ